MKRFSEQFKKQGERIVMRASEKNELKARIVSYIEYHPLPKEVLQKAVISEKVTTKDAIVSEPFFALSLQNFPFRSFAGFFVLFVVVGIPLVAEKALPGDVLYPVKVQFTEEVRSSLSFSTYAKVEWETQRLERRISEARLLATEGKLTEDAQADFAEAVKLHTDAAQREIAVLKESDTDSAAIAEIAFASALEVQSQVLQGHMDHESGSSNSQGAGHSIVALAEVVAEARTSAEAAQSEAKPSYEKLLAAIEEESTQVYELFESVKKNAQADEVTDIERRFTDIERKMRVAVAYKEGTVIADEAVAASKALSMSKQTAPASEDNALFATSIMDETTTTSSISMAMSVATDSMESVIEIVPVESLPAPVSSTEPELVVYSEEEATELLRATLKDIQKLLNYLTNIDVRENVSIDELVPLTPTVDEKASEVMRLFDDALAIQAVVEQKSIPSSLRGKVSQGMKSLTSQFKTITTAMERGDLDTALIAATEAHAIAVDLQVLTSDQKVIIIEEPIVAVDASTTTVVVEE